MKVKQTSSKTVIDITDEDIGTMLANHMQQYFRRLVSFEEILGYLLAFQNLGILSIDEYRDYVQFIINMDERSNAR